MIISFGGVFKEERKLSITVNKSFGQFSGIPGTSLNVGNMTVFISKTKNIRNQNQFNRTKRKLQYNSKEISSQLMRVKKSGNASMILAKAKSRLGRLSRHLGSGQYDEKEVQAAIAHAKRMVKVARLKVSNLKEEERMNVDNQREKVSNEVQKSNELKRRVYKRKQESKAKITIEEAKVTRKEKAKAQKLMLKQRMNRQTELDEITKADIEYLKSKMGDGRESNRVDTTGVVLELSASAAGLQDLALLEKQVELEIEQEMQMQMEIINGSLLAGDLSSAVMHTGNNLTISGGGAVDISI